MITATKIKAFPVYVGNSGCDFHRVRLPFIHGHELYNHEVYGQIHVSKLLEYIEMSDVVVYNRHFPLKLEVLEEIRKKSNVKFVCDLDDWYKLPDYHPMYKHYREVGAKTIMENLKFADCVTVTTERLYHKVKELNNNVHIIPNALPFGGYQFTPRPERLMGELFNFVYAGQSSHLEDVRLIQAAVRRMSRSNLVSFTLAGFKPHPIWYAIEKVFNQGGVYERIESKRLDEYMTVYDTADCSLVPLCVNDFNSCKSNLKLLEAAAKKLPCIVSHVPPYRDNEDAPVLWVKHPDDWYKHMKFLSENRDYAVKLGQDLHDWAIENYHLDHWNKVRFQIYESLVK
jgi:hypothetical protein